MESKKIKCPGCGVILEVRNSNNEAVRTFRCPRCKVGLQVTFREEEPATVLGNKQQGNARQSHPRLLYGGEEFALCDGRNVVGREAQSSQATVQIPTPDHFMSRHHAVVMVSALADGSRKAVLCCYQNKNALIVDGQPLEPGDEVRLHDGCRITMGETTVTFKC